jgi:hypothetical protein
MTDSLRAAAESLRDRYDGSSDCAADTEARVLASLAASARKRRARVLYLLPVAAAFVASSAWAGATGRLHSLVVAVHHLIEPAARAPAASPMPNHARSANPPAPVREPEIAAPAPPPEPAVPTPSPRAGPSAKPVVPVSPVPSAALPSVNPPAEPPRATDADDLYRAAHHAHFVDRDPVAAVAAWDRYLAIAPHGPMAPEARYDRAIDLVRLDRRDEAVAALRPFAEGDYGPYHQADARALIERLSGGSP